MKALRLVIKGKVQGVFFRKYTRDKAKALGLKGFVRNCDDGTVEVVAEGDEVPLHEFLHWCYQGSPRAEVETINTEEIDYSGFKLFEIKR